MKTHLIKIKYNSINPSAVFMGKSFTRKEILHIASEICEKFTNIYYDELRTTFACNSHLTSSKVMRYLIDKYFYIE